MTIRQPPALLPRLQVLAAAALFSTGGAAIKATALSAWQVASFRSGVAALVLAAVFFRGGGRIASPRVMAVGLAYALALTTYVIANKATTAAAAIFLVSTSPLWVLLLSPRWLGERVHRRDLGLIAALVVGMSLVLASPSTVLETAGNPRLGNWVAVGSGLAWALTVIGLRWLSRGREAAVGGGALGASATAFAGRAVVWGNIFALLLALPPALPVARIEPLDLGVIAYLGLAQIGLAYLLLLAGLRRVTALEASLLLILEPVLSPLWSWLLHAEAPPPATFLGGALILSAIAVHSRVATAATGGRSAANRRLGAGSSDRVVPRGRP